MPNLRSTLALPCSFGKYELLEHIGSGGMAEVYRARHPGIAGFEKIVVVKRLHPHLLDEQVMVALFIEEAKLAAQVQHKNVVQVFELDQLPNGEYYIVMEYVAGTDMRKLLAHSRRSLKRIPPWLSTYAMIEVLDALVYANGLLDAFGRRRNIVHRDVSPDNIFVSDLGDIKLGDFGVAKDDTRAEEPAAGQIKGKISYMAPEQFAGLPIDQRYDVFALGIVLWELLTQRPLFRGGSTAETMHKICHGPRTPPSQLAQHIPPELDRCILWALEADVNRRLPSTRQMQAMLLEILPTMRPNAGPIEVRAGIERLLGEEITVPTPVPPSAPAASSVRPARHRPVTEPLEITDDLIVSESHVDTTRNFRAIYEQRLVERATGTRAPRASTPWDGTYAIINPRLRTVAPMEAKPSATETDDLVARHLVFEIPMPGGPGVVETGDIVKRASSDVATPAAFGPNQGGEESIQWNPDTDVTPLETSSSSARVWAPYEGPYPFWIRSRPHLETEHPATFQANTAAEDVVFGPCSLADLILTIRARMPEHSRRFVDVSADGKRWVSLQEYLELTGQALMENEGHLPEGAPWGMLEGAGVIPLFGRIAQHKPTGRLTVLHHAPTRVDAIEIHVVQGAPTLVATNDSVLDTPGQLVAHRIVEVERLEAYLHAVAADRRPLRELVLAGSGVDIQEYRSRFMSARLEPLLAWNQATYAFSADAPALGTPFAPSLLAPLPGLIQRMRSVEQLRGALETAIEAGFERAEHFDPMLAQLSLSEAQLAGVNPFGLTRTLGEAMRCSLGGEKFALAMGWLFLQLGMLRPRSRSFSSLPWPR